MSRHRVAAVHGEPLSGSLPTARNPGGVAETHASPPPAPRTHPGPQARDSRSQGVPLSPHELAFARALAELLVADLLRNPSGSADGPADAGDAAEKGGARQ